MDSTLPTIQPQLLTMTAEQLRALWPILALILGGLITILVSTSKWATFLVTLASLIASGVLAGLALDQPAVYLFADMMTVDSFSNFFHLLFVACALLTVLFSFRYLERENLPSSEYLILILFGTMGMSFLTSSLDFISLFIALEIMSLSVYLLVGYRRSDRKSNEASLKYFILGGVASAIFLYGSSLLYGASGSIKIPVILNWMASGKNSESLLFILGAGLVMVGFLFKVAAVPFHMWMPDVYEGAPVPVTGFMTTALKAASFAAFIRVIVSLGYGKGMTPEIQAHFHQILWIGAVLTMSIANVVALTQKNLKRMLAYSSISHTGYLLVGMLCLSKGQMAIGPLILYLVSYCIMNLGAFCCLTILSGKGDLSLQLQDISGLSRSRPWISFAFSLFLLSMAGMPPTAGFAAKYTLFYAAVQAGETPLVVWSVLCSAISVFYYLRVIAHLYMREPSSLGETQGRISRMAGFALLTTVILTLQVGLQPEAWIQLTQRLLGSL